MSTATLDKNDDWAMGLGKNAYLVSTAETSQNVVTRLREFKDDWFLDVEKGIDWINLLSVKNSKNFLLSDIKKVILETEGVATINEISIDDDRENRNINLSYSITTIFNTNITNNLEIF